MKTFFLFIGLFLCQFSIAQQSKFFNTGSVPTTIDTSETILIYLAEEGKDKEWLAKKLKKKNPEFKFNIINATDEEALSDKFSEDYRYTIKAIKGPLTNITNINSFHYHYTVTLMDKTTGETFTWNNKFCNTGENGPAQLFRYYFLEMSKFSKMD